MAQQRERDEALEHLNIFPSDSTIDWSAVRGVDYCETVIGDGQVQALQKMLPCYL